MRVLVAADLGLLLISTLSGDVDKESNVMSSVIIPSPYLRPSPERKCKWFKTTLSVCNTLPQNILSKRKQNNATLFYNQLSSLPVSGNNKLHSNNLHKCVTCSWPGLCGVKARYKHVYRWPTWTLRHWYYLLWWSTDIIYTNNLVKLSTHDKYLCPHPLDLISSSIFGPMWVSIISIRHDYQVLNDHWWFLRFHYAS